jgi:peptide/nickel transport system substrate-binding protein
MNQKKINRVFKKRYSKRLNQFEQLGSETSDKFEKNFVKRLSRLESVGRFTFIWTGGILILIFLVILQTLNLSNYFQVLKPIPGGTFTEGIFGNYTNSNPIYASTEVDHSISSLIFAGLLRYNSQNQLVGDLSTSYTVDSSGLDYTFNLRPNLKWQDGQPLTSRDVAYTFNLIKNPNSQSPLFASWQNIKISIPTPNSVVFTLPNPLSSFPESLTTGILPAHLLNNIPIESLRTANFNTISPIGSGPFKLTAVKNTGSTIDTQKETIELSPFSNYWMGRPKLDSFVIQAYSSKTFMISDFKNGSIDAISGLSDTQSGLSKSTKIYSFPLTAANMVFFKTTSAPLNDVNVRQALELATNQQSIIKSLNYKTIAVDEPLLKGQLAYNPKYAQAAYNITTAASKLNADGWVLGSDGYRHKAGQTLTVNLTASNSNESSSVAERLSNDWKNIGVKTNLNLLSDSDLEYSLSYHNYNALLYGISIGVDPDVYAYWDSSQADPRSPFRLNLSEYSSVAANESLEQGRTRLDPNLRVIKYQSFLQAFQNDVPAIGLYQPRYLYISNLKIFGLREGTINTATDRYNNVVNWEIRQAKFTK